MDWLSHSKSAYVVPGVVVLFLLGLLGTSTFGGYHPWQGAEVFWERPGWESQAGPPPNCSYLATLEADDPYVTTTLKLSEVYECIAIYEAEAAELNASLAKAMKEQNTLQQGSSTKQQEEQAARDCPVCLGEAAKPDPVQFAPSLKWEPKENQYLLALCVPGGDISVRQECVRRFAILAALLGRTLILPPKQTDVALKSSDASDWLVDADYANNKCLGDGRVQLFSKIGEVIQDENVSVPVLCLVSGEGCSAEPWCSGELGVGQKFNRDGNCTEVSEEDGKKGLASKENFIEAFGGRGEKVISFCGVSGLTQVGDVQFLVDNRPNGMPFEIIQDKGCNLALRPLASVTDAAFQFIRRFIGIEFVAIELRRKDVFLKNCADNLSLCHTRLQPFVECILRATCGPRANLSSVFLVSDLKREEMNLLQTYIEGIVQKPFPVSPLFPIPPATWSGPINGDDQYNPSVLRLVEQVICAMGPVFISTKPTPFAASVMQMRAAFGSPVCADCMTCSAQISSP
eukprot:TRINITY_DN3182_c0_g2_i4.p1 TRINITY_DN3182_c0_g2~~TRINITY_DN3182_c0_g2_i4.p1  ORF type:complete len:548 (+),score=64.90 TRINITY_DN3182_c0_g2_i4:100-1644(+)